MNKIFNMEQEDFRRKRNKKWTTLAKRIYTILENISTIKEDESFIHIIKLACYYSFSYCKIPILDGEPLNELYGPCSLLSSIDCVNAL